MNENDFEKNDAQAGLGKDAGADEPAGKDAAEDVPVDSGLPGVLLPAGDEHDRDSYDDISAGDSGQAFGSVSSGDYADEDVSAGDAFYGSSGSVTPAASETLVSDSPSAALPLEAKIDSVNATLSLILIFLLCDFTIKRISLCVRRFSGEGRKN